MKIAIRLDDITPNMDWPRFLAFKRLLDRYNIKPLIGVIPLNKDESIDTNPAGAPVDYSGQPSFGAYIRELKKQGWVVAMHGYQHLYTTNKRGLFPLNNFSEFAGLDYECQYALLKAGKEQLFEHGIAAEIFMAPAHSYDRNTLRVLKELGFSGITDGFGRCPYFWHGLNFYPISFHQKSSLQKKNGVTSIVVHTNTLTPAEMERYEKVFENPGNTEWISFQKYLEIPPERRFFWGRAWEFCLALAKAVMVKAVIVHR